MDNGAREASPIVTLSVNTWYNIRVRFNFVAGEMDIYINGKLIRKADLLALNEGYDFGNVDQMHIAIHSHYEASVKAYHYLDNVAVQVIDTAYPQFDGAKLIGVQKSKNGNDVRILAGISSLNYSNVGFTFELLAEDGSGWRQVDDRNVNVAYTSITAAGETVNAVDEGCRYFIMAVIKDIDSDGILCIRPYTTRDGVRKYGEEEIYSMKVNDGGLFMEKITLTTIASDYVVYKHESFEDAKESFSMYGLTPSATDTNEYRLGGQMLSTSIPVGTTTANARTGEKSMSALGFAPTADDKYSARLKLNNLMPFNIEDYVNKDIKITAYIKLTELIDGDSTVSIKFGLMGDKDYTELTYKTIAVAGGEWTLIEYEGRITEDLISSLGDGYPARVFIGLGNASRHAANIYLDDVTVYFKPSVGVTLPSIFADGMVLQRNKPVKIWGWNGLAGDIIEAKIGTTSATATVDANGEFIVQLPAMSATSKQTLTVTNTTSGASVVYTNIGIGEVWYCSGQSNMELKMGQVHNAEAIVADASNCDIRSFKINISSKYTLQKDVSGGTWKQITTDNTSGVSAIGYMTAYNVYKVLNLTEDVPVAIIESYNGGSSANAWLSRDKVFAADRAEIYDNEDWIPKNADGSVMTAGSGGLEGKTMYEDYEYYWQVGTSAEGTLRAGEHGNIGNRFAPTGLYNGMQGPLANYALAGVMWYQGEARTNSLRPEEYNYILNDLVEQWREDFCDENLPVVIFQLAPYSDYYNLIRQVQLDTAKRFDNVYAITTAYEGAVYSAASGELCLDLDRDKNGKGNGIHPGTKVPVAERAAYTLLSNVYGESDDYATYLNPEYLSISVNGNVATLTFANADGLKVRDGDSALTGFRAYAADGTELMVSSAVISGETVVITTAEGTLPVKITYAFDNSGTRRQVSYASLAQNDGYAPQYINVMTGNLENGKGQPAIPFLAEVSEANVHEVSAADGKLYVEIRELGHTVSSYKVQVKIGEN
jgi:sialate O-acetylesterase